MTGMGGNYSAIMATQAVATVATNAAAKSAQEEAMDALGGAAKSNIKKGDTITLEFKLIQAWPRDASRRIHGSCESHAEWRRPGVTVDRAGGDSGTDCHYEAANPLTQP